jgi:uncharacterized Rmd1/YagE family protein
LFGETDTIEGCATFVGQRIQLGQVREFERLASSPLTVRLDEGGIAVLFRYGVVVVLGLAPEQGRRWIEAIMAHVVDPFDRPETENFVIHIDPGGQEGVVDDGVSLGESSLQGMQVVADVVAKNLVLTHYESALTAQFDRIDPLAEGLSRGQYRGPKGRHLIAHVGDALMIEAKMIGRIEITETPDLIWDHPEYERLFLRLRDGYDLADRHEAIMQKLALISKTAQTLLDLIQNERSLRVEWYIVILIVVDIVIALSDKVF